MPRIGDYNPDAKPLDPLDPVPTGEYRAMIIDSDVKPTKEGTGDRVTLTWEIIDGEYKGRKLFSSINIRNASPKAAEIGQREFASVIRAVGVSRPQATEELHDRPASLKVKFVPAGPDKSGVYRDSKNEIKDYLPIGQAGQSQAPTAPTPTQTPAAQSPANVAATGGSTPPWKRK